MEELLTPVQKVKNWEIIDYASDGNLTQVEKLLKENCDINIIDDFGQTPLYTAIIFKCKDIVELLLKNGADPNMPSVDNSPPLCAAASTGRKEMVEILLRYGARVNMKDKFGRTELHAAASKRSVEIAKLVLKHGSDITIENQWGRTPVHTAISSGYLETVMVMLPYIYDINRKWSSSTYLHHCLSSIAIDTSIILEFLLKNGANPLIENKHHKTPLQVAHEQLKLGYEFYGKCVPLLEKYEKITIEKKILLCSAHELDEGSLLHKYFIGNGVFGMMMAYFG